MCNRLTFLFQEIFKNCSSHNCFLLFNKIRGSIFLQSETSSLSKFSSPSIFKTSKSAHSKFPLIPFFKKLDNPASSRSGTNLYSFPVPARSSPSMGSFFDHSSVKYCKPKIIFHQVKQTPDALTKSFASRN